MTLSRSSCKNSKRCSNLMQKPLRMLRKPLRMLRKQFKVLRKLVLTKMTRLFRMLLKSYKRVLTKMARLFRMLLKSYKRVLTKMTRLYQNWWTLLEVHWYLNHQFSLRMTNKISLWVISQAKYRCSQWNPIMSLGIQIRSRSKVFVLEDGVVQKKRQMNSLKTLLYYWIKKVTWKL